MRYESKWGRSIVYAILLHLVLYWSLINLHPEVEPVEDDAFVWMELYGDVDAGEVAPETPLLGEEVSLQKEDDIEAASIPIAHGEAEDGKEDKDRLPSTHHPSKSSLERNRQDIQRIGHPAMLDLKTKVSLKEDETDYRGKATFYVTVRTDGHVGAVKEMQLDPPVEDKMARRELEAKIAGLVMFKWRYTPSKTADGVPQAQTKKEEMVVPQIADAVPRKSS